MQPQPPNEGQPRPPQQPYYPQPGQQYGPQYPQQQPYYPPPPGQQVPPPRKKRRRWPIFLLIGALLLCVIIGVAVAASSQSAKSPTSTSATGTTANTATTVPTKVSTPVQQKWTTTHTFSGNGNKKTAIFSVPDDWKIAWKCDPTSFSLGQYNVIVTVYNSDNTPSDVPINTICKTGNTGDSTEIHVSGSVYLDVASEGAWTVMVQELK